MYLGLLTNLELKERIEKNEAQLRTLKKSREKTVATTASIRR